MWTRLLIAVLGWLVLSLPGLAQNQPPEAPVEDSAPISEDPAAEDRDETGSEDDDDSSDLEEFIFSEEIPADQQLVFPVDI